MLRPVREVRLGEYILCPGYKVEANRPGGSPSYLPIPGYTYWFSFDAQQIGPPYWIFLYTGPGERRMTTELNSKEPALILHWGQTQTLFGIENVDPVLLHLDGIVGPSASPLSAVGHLPTPKSESALLELLSDYYKALQPPKK